MYIRYFNLFHLLEKVSPRPCCHARIWISWSLGPLWQRRQWHPTPVLLRGKSHGWRSLIGCSPWGRWELDTTQWLHFHFSLSCIGEGNGNLLHVLAWRIPETEEPRVLLSMGSHRVGHNWSDLAAATAAAGPLWSCWPPLSFYLHVEILFCPRYWIPVF